MAYEPLNLQNGQVLTAEDVQHIEQGVQNVLPQNPGAYQYPATDGDGNMVWADRLAYETTQNVEIQNGSVAAGPVAGALEPFAISASNDVLAATALVIGDTYVVVFDGVSYTGTAVTDPTDVPSTPYKVLLFARDYSDAPIYFSAYQDAVYMSYENEDDYSAHSLQMYHVVNVPKTIDPKFLPAMESNVFIIAKNDTDRGTDKTWEEIVAAYNSGSAIFLRSGKPSDPEFPQYPMLMSLSYINTSSYDGEATFCGMFYDGTDFRACRTVVRSDGTIGGNQRIITTTTV